MRLPDEREWGTDALMTCAPRTNSGRQPDAKVRWDTLAQVRTSAALPLHLLTKHE